MGKKRQRLFFLQDISVQALTKLLFYSMLLQNASTRRLTGRDMQQYIANITENYWYPGNDTTYTLLNNMEKEGYITSYWLEGVDKNKRYKRLYSITDKGIEEYKAMKVKYLSYFNSIINLVDCAIKFLYSKEPELQVVDSVVMSSTLFQEINILQVLALQKDYISGIDIMRTLHSKYTYWKPSIGVLYPVLSNLSIKRLVWDKWSLDLIGNSTKKKTLREYTITSEGKKQLEYYKYNTDFYMQLIKIKNMFKRFLEIMA